MKRFSGLMAALLCAISGLVAQPSFSIRNSNNFGGTSIFCSGENIECINDQVAVFNDYTYEWKVLEVDQGESTYANPSNLILNYTVDHSTRFTITLVASKGASVIESRSVTVTVLAGPQVEIAQAVDKVCAGEQVSLKGIIPASVIQDQFPSMHWWSMGTKASKEIDILTDFDLGVNSDEKVVYALTAIDTNGCSATATHVITHLRKPMVSLSVSNNVVRLGEAVKFMARGAQSYHWSLGTATAFAFQPSGNTLVTEPSSNGTFTVEGTDKNGCSGEASLSVRVALPIREIEGAVNFITPNRNKNIAWSLDNGEMYADFEFKVFNDLGQVIYKGTRGQAPTWDAKTDNGDEVPSGTYYYFLEGVDVDRNSLEVLYSGYITVLR